MRDKHFKMTDDELIKELEEKVKNIKFALEVNKLWKKKIRATISKCCESLGKW